MAQHRDEATAHAGRQYSKNVDSGGSVLTWAGRFAARTYTVGLVPRRLGTTLCTLKCT